MVAPNNILLMREPSGLSSEVKIVNDSLEKAAKKMTSSDNASQGTADNTQIVMQTNQRGPHTLGNTLAQKQSLNMSNYIGDYTAILPDSSIQKQQMNLTSLLRSNLLEEDGIEDLHFYFVSF